MRTWRDHISMTSSFAGGRIGGIKGMSPGRHHRLSPFPLPRPRQIFSFFVFTHCLDLCIQTVFTFFRTTSFAKAPQKTRRYGSVYLGVDELDKIERGLHVKMLDSAPFTVRPWKNDSRILQHWSYYVRINSARHSTTPKELKTERDCSHRQLFRPLSMATTPLCFEFFPCRVDVLQS